MTVPVTVRISDFTGIPDIPDTIGDSSPRGLSIKFQLPDGSGTDVVAHSFDGFPVDTTNKFITFLRDNPETAIGELRNPVLFRVNAFKLTNKAGKSAIIRYQFIPEAGEQFLPAEQLKSADQIT